MVIFPQVDNDSGKEELMYLCEYNPPIRERYENPAGCGCKWYTKNAEKTEGRRIFLKISVAFCLNLCLLCTNPRPSAAICPNKTFLQER